MVMKFSDSKDFFFPCKSWRRNALVFFIFSLRTSFGDSVRLCHAGIFLSHEHGSEFFSDSINLLIFYFKINTIYLKYWWNNIIYKIIYFIHIIIFTCCVLKPWQIQIIIFYPNFLQLRCFTKIIHFIILQITCHLSF
jgi:hypothetical protein